MSSINFNIGNQYSTSSLGAGSSGGAMPGVSTAGSTTASPLSSGSGMNMGPSMDSLSSGNNQFANALGGSSSGNPAGGGNMSQMLPQIMQIMSMMLQLLSTLLQGQGGQSQGTQSPDSGSSTPPAGDSSGSTPPAGGSSTPPTGGCPSSSSGSSPAPTGGSSAPPSGSATPPTSGSSTPSAGGSTSPAGSPTPAAGSSDPSSGSNPAVGSSNPSSGSTPPAGSSDSSGGATPSAGGSDSSSGSSAPSGQGHMIGQIQATNPSKYDKLINDAIQKYGGGQKVDPNIIKGMIWQESKGDPMAAGSLDAQGSKGLLQVTAANAQQYGFGNQYDPAQSIGLGVKMYADALKHNNGDVTAALGEYNQGPGAKTSPAAQTYAQQVQGWAKDFAQNPNQLPGGAKEGQLF